MLRITIDESNEAMGFTLAGRLAGPWVEELNRVWSETTPRLEGKKVQLDLRDVTYSDAAGRQVLRAIYAQTRAELIAESQWSQHLANEIRNSNGTMEVGHANAQ